MLSDIQKEVIHQQFVGLKVCNMSIGIFLRVRIMKINAMSAFEKKISFYICFTELVVETSKVN